MIDHGYYQSEMDFWLEKAIADIKINYGHDVSCYLKGKDLLKYGRSNQVSNATRTTLMDLPSGVLNETYLSDNLITTLSSASTLDTADNNASDVIVEGHTISGGDLTFVVQSAALNGQNQVTLTTPLVRANRIYNNDTANITGPVYVYQDDTSTAGVPDTSTGVHLMLAAGKQQSEKAATSISSTDYWVITGTYASVLDKTGSPLVDVSLEQRQIGKVFRPNFFFGVDNSGVKLLSGNPYLIIRPNSDVRLTAIADAAGREAAGGMFGTLLKIV